jgi:hypothetical protein
MNRLLLLLVLALPASAGSDLPPAAPRLVQSHEPFRLNPRFCFGSIGNSCERQPLGC